MFINKILSKYIHVGYCFEGFIVRNTMGLLKFNLDACLIAMFFKTSYKCFASFPRWHRYGRIQVAASFWATTFYF